MGINKKFTEHEIEILKKAENDFNLIGKTNIKCPRCNGKLIYTEVSTSYSIECENKCGIKFSVRGI